MSIAHDWDLLGIEPTDDRREVKRAYSRALKQIDVDADPAAFVRLRQALDTVLEWGIRTPWWDEEDNSAEEDWSAEAAGMEADAYETEDDPDWHVATGWAQDRYNPILPESAAELQDLLSTLETLLFSPAPDRDEVERLSRAILASPNLDNVDVAAAVEEWMASMIASAIPASDPLIDPALRRFGWERHRGVKGALWVQGVLDRVVDRRMLVKIAAPGHVHHKALKELQGPARHSLNPLQSLLADKVADFLAFVRTEHPTIEHDLDEAQVRWWDDYLRVRPLPRNFWRWMAGGSALTLLGLCGILPRSADDINFLIIVLGAVAITYIIIRSAMAFRHKARSYDDSLVWEKSSAPFALVTDAISTLPLLFAVLPSGLAFLALSIIATLALGAAAYFQTSLSEWEDDRDKWRRRFFPMGAAFIAICILTELPDATAFQLIGPFALCCWFGARAWYSASLHLEKLTGRQEFALLLVITGLVIASLGVMILGTFFPLPVAMLAIVPVAIIAQHLALSARPIYLPKLDWPLRAIVVTFHFAMADVLPPERPGLQSLTIAVMAYCLIFSLVKLGVRLKTFRPRRVSV